jgi:hypothetical protein
VGSIPITRSIDSKGLNAVLSVAFFPRALPARRRVEVRTKEMIPKWNQLLDAHLVELGRIVVAFAGLEYQWESFIIEARAAIKTRR